MKINDLINVGSPFLCTIAGRSGSGKSIILKKIIDDYNKINEKVLCVTDADSLLDLTSKLDNYNVFTIDKVFCDEKELKQLLYLLVNKKVFITQQLITRIFNGSVVKTIDNKTLFRSTFVFIIDRDITLSIKEKIKYLFLFWLEKPNIRIDLIKNRFGPESSENLFIDFNLKNQ